VLTPPSSLPLFSSKFDDVGSDTRSIRLTGMTEFSNSPKGTGVGEDAGCFSIFYFAPELAPTLLPVMEQNPPEIIIGHHSQLEAKTAGTEPVKIHDAST
jgi:hypothetical protein